MTTTASHASTAAHASNGSPKPYVSAPATANDLARMDVHALESLYRQATVPPLEDLAGTPRGRMLTLVGPLGRARPAELLRRFAGSQAFPWEGKSFTMRSGRPGKDQVGAGINRVKLVGDLFAFDTFVGTSAIDGAPTIILDYDKPANPWPIRQIHDELRQVASGLYLGPAMWKSKRGPKLVLFFAIDKTAS
jgi:hypothetical protein